MRGEDEQQRSHLDGKYEEKNLFIRKRENEKKRSLPKVARLTEDIPLSRRYKQRRFFLLFEQRSLAVYLLFLKFHANLFDDISANAATAAARYYKT